MIKLIKKRIAKLSKRGLYLQDKELRQTNFKIGQHFKYEVDLKKKQIRIVSTDEQTKNIVSKRMLQDGLKPVIDIRDKGALQVFNGAEQLEVIILENEVLVRGIVKEAVLSSELLQFADYARSEQKLTVAIDKAELASVAGSFTFSTTSDQDTRFFSDNPQFFSELPIALKAASFFSGAGGMDFSMLSGMNEGTNDYEEQLEIVFAVEKDEHAAETYRYNIGDHIHCEDICDIEDSLPYQLGATIHFSGTPCQGFSNANRRSDKKISFLENPNNLLVRQYIAKTKANPNCAVFIWENVPQLLTKGSAFFLQEIKRELADFEITTGVLNARDFGCPQERERAFLIGSKIGRIELPKPQTTTVKTVAEAFDGLNDSIPNQMDYSKSRNDTIERMKAIPPGCNWESLPASLRNKGMKKGVTQSNIYKRLDPDKAACTIVNVRKCLLMPPHENRVLSVRECARLFSLPDTFVFKGPLEAKQQQICNTTCVGVIKAIAKQVKDKICAYNALLKRSKFVLV